VHAFGNWWLGLLELYLRNPLADLFAVFQDDILMCRNTREYVEASIGDFTQKNPKPPYFNLFTCKPNEELIRRTTICATCEREGASPAAGWYLSNQWGWGGQALVFPRDTMVRMFQSKHLTERPLGMKNGVPRPEKAWINLDGGVSASVKSFGGVEAVHYPSLVHHVECQSVIGNTRDRRTEQGEWPGEDFDAVSWLKRGSDPKPLLVGQQS
jgi:hypothetical protein